MTRPLSEILLEARELIARPGGWTKGDFGRDNFGAGVGVIRLRQAESFCVLGACIVFGLGYGDACTVLSPVCPDANPAKFNDAPTTTQLMAVEALERAAVLALKEEGKL